MTAEELLMMSDEIETYSADDALVIDAENRIILTPAGGLLLGVESDEEAERIKFVCPRIVGDNIDLSTLQLRAIYRNANGDKDFRICTDITIDGENIRFSWSLSRKVTRYKGAVKFIICAIRTQSDGSIKNEWNTTLAEGKVLEGLEVDISEEEFEEPKDIVLQLLGMLDEKEAELLEEVEKLRTDVKADIETTKQKAMDDVEAKGVETLKTIPEDYTYVYNLAEENKQYKANAIKRTYSGETIVATDSAEAKFEGFSVFGKSTQMSTTGKNLLNNTGKTTTTNGVTFTVNDDGSVTVNGTSTNVTYFAINEFEYRDGTYILNGTPSGGGRESYCVYDDVLQKYDLGQGVEINGNQQGKIYIRIASGVTLSNVTLYPMIRLASNEDDTYEPYTGGQPSPSPSYQQPFESAGDDGNISVGVYGKNFIIINKETTTVNGVTFTINNDGSVTVNGTATDVAYLNLNYVNSTTKSIPTGDYVLSGGLSLDVSVRAYVSSAERARSNGGDVAFYITNEDVNSWMRIFIQKGVTVSNVTIYPMVRRASISDATFEKGVEPQSLITSTPNGLPAIKVTEASLATYTDSDDVMWCADEVVCGEKKIQRVNDIVFDGTEGGWSLYESATYTGFKITIPSMKPNMRTNGLCSHFKPQSSPANSSNNGVTFGASNSVIYFTFSEERFSTVDDWKAYLAEQYANGTPVTVKYILAEPIEIDLSTSEIEAYKALTSNYPTTTILNDENAHMEAVLVTDTKNHIEQNYVPKSEFLSVVDRVSALEQKALA